jgi:integrase
MASIQERAGKWRVIVRKQGVTKTKTFERKSDAKAWATSIEAEIIAGTTGTIPNKTFGELVSKYVTEVSVNKDGRHWEEIRGKSFQNEDLSKVRLEVLNKTHIAAWRDRRLAVVSAGTVLREWNFLSAVCTKAINEWGWLHKHPMSSVKRPTEPDARDRLISAIEIEQVCIALGYSKESALSTVSSRIGAAFLFAIETAMRIGEICNLQKSDLFLSDGYLKVTGESQGGRKTLAAKRDVPLSPEAIRIIQQLPDFPSGSVFDIKSASADSLFREAVKTTLIEDLTFHDTRHEAITRLAKTFTVLPLARAVGHRDIKELMRYYNETAAEMSKLLQEGR